MFQNLLIALLPLEEVHHNYFSLTKPLSSSSSPFSTSQWLHHEHWVRLGGQPSSDIYSDPGPTNPSHTTLSDVSSAKSIPSLLFIFFL